MKATSKGLQFEKEFGEGLQQIFPFVVKMPDTRSLRLKQKIIEAGAGKTFHSVMGLKSPADYWTMLNGTSTLWECKQSQGVNKNYDFPTRNVKEHQLETLLKHKDNGGRSYLVINVKNKKADINEYFVIDINKYIYLTSLHKSIPRIELSKYNYIDLERLTPTKSPNGRTMIKCTCQ